MVKNHLKTIATPKTWPVNRKRKIFIKRPNPGPHNMESAVTLNYFLIDMIGLTNTKKETVFVLHNKEVLVNGAKRQDPAFPVGLFDVITIKEIKKSYRIMLGRKGKLTTEEIKDANIKPHKIMGKSYVKGKLQLNFLDGSNMIAEKDQYKVGDTIVIDHLKNEIKEHLELKKGNLILLTGGKHIGNTGMIEDVAGKKIIYKIKSDVHESLRKYAFVLGKDKPVIEIEK